MISPIKEPKANETNLTKTFRVILDGHLRVKEDNTSIYFYGDNEAMYFVLQEFCVPTLEISPKKFYTLGRTIGIQTLECLVIFDIPISKIPKINEKIKEYNEEPIKELKKAIKKEAQQTAEKRLLHEFRSRLKEDAKKILSETDFRKYISEMYNVNMKDIDI